MKRSKKWLAVIFASLSTMAFAVVGTGCSDVGDKVKTKVDQLFCKHDYDEGVVEKAATCGETGILLKTCEKCGKETETSIKKLEHATIVQVEAVEPTCTEKGSMTGTKCNDCGEWIVKPEEIPAKGHTLQTVKGYAATCTENGLSDGAICTVCDEEVVAQEVIRAHGHRMVVDAGVEATCTSTGLTEGNHCSRCNEIGIAQRVIEKKAHTPDEDGNCTTCGLIDYEAFISNGVTTKEVEGNIKAGKVYRIDLTKYAGEEPLGLYYKSEDTHYIVGSFHVEINPGVVSGTAGNYTLKENPTSILRYMYQPVPGSYDNVEDFEFEINLLDYFEFHLDGNYLDIVVLKDEVVTDRTTLVFFGCSLGAMTELVRNEATAQTVSAEWVLPDRKVEIIDDYGDDIYFD